MSELKNNQPSLNEGTKEPLPKKKSRLGNIKNAVNKAIAEIGIAGSLLGGTIAPEVASTALIPETAATITTMAPTTGAAVKTIALGTAAALASACDRPDITPPTINIREPNITITKPETLHISDNQIYLGNTLIATCDDPESGIANLFLSIDGGDTLTSITVSKSCTVQINASNKDNLSTKKTFKINVIDDKIPEFSFNKTELTTITQGGNITINSKDVFVGSEKIFSWDSDDYVPSFKLNNKAIELPFTLTDSGNYTLECKLTNKNNGKSISKTSTIKVEEEDNNHAPEITRMYEGIPNILGGVITNGEDNQLLFGDVIIYKGKDDNTQICTPSLKLKGSNEEKIGKEINIASTYVYTLTDEKGKSTSVEFQIETNSIDVTSLNNLNMQVGKEIDLLEGISIPNGIKIDKLEIEINGQRSEVSDSQHYTPNKAGTCYIYITEKGEFGNTYVEKSKNPLTIKDIEYPEYQSIDIRNINPIDVFPQISHIESGDPDIYEYVKDLGVAETYVMRNMMGKYGTSTYSPEEYQKLLSRVTIGLISEISDDYQNYERIGPTPSSVNITDHGRNTFQNLTSLKGKYTNIKNLANLGEGRGKNLSEYAKAHPDNIFIFSGSTTPTADTQSEYEQDVFNQNIIELCNLPNVIIFIAGGDTKTIDGVTFKKIYNGVYKSNGDGRYLNASMANSDQNNYPDSNMKVIIGTDSQGNADMTNSLGSLFPIGFNTNALVSGHPILPFYNFRGNGTLFGEDLPVNGSYITSYVTPTTASLAQEIFGLRADVKNADYLLQMIESTTETDYISLNGKKQALPKYSPANFSKKYCIISDIPSSIKSGETITLTKGRYKGIIFDIPGAEVKINGQRIAYNKENESLIKSQNPMHLEWRLNADEAMKYGNNNLKGKIIAVDDEWNGLNIEKDINVSIQ